MPERCKILGLALMLAVIVGCATAPPVQEMSDARQAIAAAREAGAERFAATQLDQAKQRLVAAQGFLNRGDTTANWGYARRDAVAAKEIALEAMLRSREARAAADAP
ncbi:MAG: hypothetical protein ACR2QB_06065 [Gammaproteobacteria bacterium]